MDDMTTLSAGMFEAARTIESLDEARKLLEEYGSYRSLHDILRDFSGLEEPKKYVIDALTPWLPQLLPDSVRSNVSNWLRSGISHREDAFRISRALHLDTDRTDAFLKMTTGEGIHWRNPRDIVWAYSALHDYGPAQVAALEEKVAAMGSTPAPKQVFGVDSYTIEVEYILRPMLSVSEEELLGWMEQEWDKLGEQHNYAYVMFNDLWGRLKNPAGESEETLKKKRETVRAQLQLHNRFLREDFLKNKENQGREFESIPMDICDKRFCEFLETEFPGYEPAFFTDEYLLNVYLFRRLIPSRKNKVKKESSRKKKEKKYSDQALSALQKALKLYWPEATSFSKIKSREVEVSRKLLLLLFLATDGEGSEFESGGDEFGRSRDDVFMGRYTRMQLMLSYCGYQPLDPRHPFDWLILFCTAADDSMDDMNQSERMEEMLLRMFPEEE